MIYVLFFLQRKLLIVFCCWSWNLFFFPLDYITMSELFIRRWNICLIFFKRCKMFQGLSLLFHGTVRWLVRKRRKNVLFQKDWACGACLSGSFSVLLWGPHWLWGRWLQHRCSLRRSTGREAKLSPSPCSSGPQLSLCGTAHCFNYCTYEWAGISSLMNVNRGPLCRKARLAVRMNEKLREEYGGRRRWGRLARSISRLQNTCLNPGFMPRGYITPFPPWFSPKVGKPLKGKVTLPRPLPDCILHWKNYPPPQPTLCNQMFDLHFPQAIPCCGQQVVKSSWFVS